MDYRDERDALRARLESLEGELASARAETERMRATENALAASQRENEKLRAEVRRLMPTAPPRPPQGASAGRTAMVVGTSIALLTVGAGLAVSLVARSPAQPTVVAADPPADVPPSAKEPDPPTPPDPPRATPVPPKVAAPAAQRQVTARWSARVASGTDSPVAPGTPCVIQATLRGDGNSAGLGDLEVACSGKALYRSSDTFSGVSNSGSNVEQTQVAGSRDFKFAVTFEDTGARSGRAQITLDTPEGTATVWRDGGYRVKLTVDELSAAVSGTPLIDPSESGFSQPITRTGKVKTSEGTVLFAPGAACTVDVKPVRGQHNCRVRVRCGSHTAYGEGSGGFNDCTLEGSQVISAQDTGASSEDNDPRLDMHLVHGTVEVSDTGASPWSVQIALDPAR